MASLPKREMPSLGEILDLAERLVRIPSVSRSEKEIADFIEDLLGACPHLALTRIGNNLVAENHVGRARRLLLAGHLDTVPPHPDSVIRRRENCLEGPGAVDMKGGLALMVWLALSAAEPEVDLCFVFYASEEISREYSGLAEIHSARPDLLHGDEGILLEPTGGIVEAGCQGTMRAKLAVRGRRAHTARPWRGLNAIHRLRDVLDVVVSWTPRRVVLSGLEYKESLQAVAVSGGVAGNVVPDEATLSLNFRFAPDRETRSAAEFLRCLFDPVLRSEDSFEVTEAAPPAPPNLDGPMAQKLLRLCGDRASAKLGWTDVATLHELGIPAVNFGPGDPELAHSPREVIAQAELERTAEVLWYLVN